MELRPHGGGVLETSEINAEVSDILMQCMPEDSTEAPPTLQDLADWFEHCPEDARQDAVKRLAALLIVPDFPDILWQEISLSLASIQLDLLFKDPPAPSLVSLMLRTWTAADPDKDKRPGFPLVPIVRAWAAWAKSLPAAVAEVTPITRRDRRILPVVRSGPPVTLAADRLPVIGGFTRGRVSEDIGQLPLFPTATKHHRVPLLELSDATGQPVMTQGKGAPLGLRLLIYPGLFVSVSDREKGPARLVFTIRQLRDLLWPNGWKKGDSWPSLRSALLEMHNRVIPDGTGGLWFPQRLVRLPAEDYTRAPPDLEDTVVLDCEYPPGSHSGPTIHLPDLLQLGVTSGPRFRAYIAAQSLIWQPGKTRRRIPNGGGRMGWSTNPADYPVIAQSERRVLAFGLQDTKHRTTEEQRAPWENLPGIVINLDAIDLETKERGWRILPANAGPNRPG